MLLLILGEAFLTAIATFDAALACGRVRILVLDHVQDRAGVTRPQRRIEPFHSAVSTATLVHHPMMLGSLFNSCRADRRDCLLIPF